MVLCNYKKNLRVIVLIVFSGIQIVSAQELMINEIMSSNYTTIADEDGDYSDWIEIYNGTNIAINIKDYAISDDLQQPDKWKLPALFIAPGYRLLIFASGKDRRENVANLHTNFKLDAQGERLSLFNPSGILVDQTINVAIPQDVSFARSPDGTNNWMYSTNPTPGTTNDTTGYLGLRSEPGFSQESGFFTNTFSVSLLSEGDSIYFTRDGSIPTRDDYLYDGPFPVFNDNDSVEVIRARSFKTGYLPSKTVTHSYFLNQEFSIPVVSLSTNPENFFDDESGIYVKGNEANENFPYWGANFWSDCPHSNMREYGCEKWERPVNIELFEPDGKSGFQVDAGARIHGHWMRGLPQKTIAIICRNSYGAGEINYQVFPDLPIDNFNSILLRQSGNDWSSTMFRDGLAATLGEHRDLDVMAFRPSILFINGEYWGIHNLREKINEHYVRSHHSVNLQNLDLIENSYGTWPLYGTTEKYNEMKDFLTRNDMSLDENYQKAVGLIDIDEFINYLIIEIYANHWDWGGNRKWWYSPGRKWRWILNDLDAAFNQYPAQTRPPEDDLFIIRFLTNYREYQRLILNANFKNKFINSFADQLNTNLKSENVIHRIDSLRAVIEPYMPDHIARWRNTFIPGEPWIGDGINSMDEWYSELDRLYDFAVIREQTAWPSINEQFGLGGQYNIEIEGDKTHGLVSLNTIILKEFPWTGKYFRNIAIELRALPRNNYTFSHWLIGGEESFENPISLTPETATSIRVTFEERAESDSNSIVINEINYHSADDFNPEDWIEIFNNGKTSVDLSNWIFKDSDDIHSFKIPLNTVLQPDGYLVLCRDTTLFRAAFPSVFNYTGNLNFGLSASGELIRLYDNTGALIDTLTFDDQEPWPVEPDGTGSTLSLRNPDLDNSNPGSWDASTGNGTPGRKNDNFVTSLSIEKDETYPEQFVLYQNYPNPFNGSTAIKFDLAHSAEVRIGIYNILGQNLLTMKQSYRYPGQYSMKWNGKMKSGTSAPSGIYYYHITIFSEDSEINIARKMLYIR